MIASYSVLLEQVRAEGLLVRCRGFYGRVARVLGIILTPFAFDSSHWQHR